jgi:hypothetical protein
MQQPSGYETGEQLGHALDVLSAREQIGLLSRATRTLNTREKFEIWRIAGFSLLRDRFFPLLLHIVLKRVLPAVLVWLTGGVLLIGILFLLALIEQLDAIAVIPVLITTLSFFAGFLLFGVIDFVRALVSFFRATSTRREREQLLARLNICGEAEKMALLRAMSASLARKVPGDSLRVECIRAALFVVSAIVLTGLVLAISWALPVLVHFPWLLFIAVGAFLLGLLVPGKIQ